MLILNLLSPSTAPSLRVIISRTHRSQMLTIPVLMKHSIAIEVVIWMEGLLASIVRRAFFVKILLVNHDIVVLIQILVQFLIEYILALRTGVDYILLVVFDFLRNLLKLCTRLCIFSAIR